MATAKDIKVAPISSSDANALVRRLHYSGKVAVNSQLHLGVYLDGQLEGAMQFGPSLDKRRMMGLVRGTKWNGFLELNRMAFGPALPRNSESRALGVAFRLIRKHYPHIEWVVSFADGTQCGDGTIYRASGFVLTGIKKNTTIWAAPSGEKFTDLGLRTAAGQKAKASAIINRVTETKGGAIIKPGETGASSMRPFKEAGWTPLPGYQLRYVYFLNPDARSRLTVPEVPFSRIAEIGAEMYLGKRITRAKDQAAGYPPALGGETPTRALQRQKRPRLIAGA